LEQSSFQQQPARRFRLRLDGATLKRFGCLTLFLYTLSMSVFRLGLIGAGRMSPAELAERMASDPRILRLSGFASVLQLAGALGIPIFAYLLVEGFLHTSSYRRYLLSVAAAALVSEVPYDFAMSGKPVDWTDQNLLLSYTICLILLYGLRMAESRSGFSGHLVRGCILAASLLWAMLLRARFGIVSAALCAAYYLLRDRTALKILAGCGISSFYLSAPLSGLLLWMYDGTRGNIRFKYLYYALYPAHLLILGAAARMVS
jgi:hypothetical protein